MNAQERSAALPSQSLERELGKPRSEWSVDDLVGIYSSHNVQIVSLMHVGGDGWLKTLDFVPQSVSHLRDIVQGGERADGSSLFPKTGIKPSASDIVLTPRAESVFLDPFAKETTLVLMCGHAGPDGSPLPQSPDTILRRASAIVQERTGCELWALGEVEYFLGKRRDESDIYGADDRGYHASSPFVFGEKLRRRALAILADLGVRVKYGHSEVGYIEAREANGVIWEQHEIELALSPLPQAAEATLLAQWVLRNLAHERGMRCNTDPMMLEGHAGNGLHFHLAPMKGDEVVAIWDDSGNLSDPAKWLIGGLVQVGGALMAFGNRVEGSFARLAQAKEAPNSIIWGEFNRLALVRLPVVPTDEEGNPVAPRTIEFRLPDGSALPHLLLAGAALSMVTGRETKDLDDLLERTSSVGAAEQTERAERVPRNFLEVADAVIRHRSTLEMGSAFPEALIDRVVAGLRG
jgi:glutamine synthetase